jgi:hypothetical protein
VINTNLTSTLADILSRQASQRTPATNRRGPVPLFLVHFSLVAKARAGIGVVRRTRTTSVVHRRLIGRPCNFDHSWRRLLTVSLLAVLLVTLAQSVGLAQADVPVGEYQVKAAFLYKFLGYVEWPGRPSLGPEDRLMVGVMGADALAEEFSQIIGGRRVNGRAVAVRKLSPADSVANLHLLFLGRQVGAGATDIIAAANAQGVLTVTESEDALSLGSIINFVVEHDRLRFDIALQQAESANVKISSRLLAVARKVD